MELAIFEAGASAPVELKRVPDGTKYVLEGAAKRFARPVRRIENAPEAKSWLDAKTGEWVIETVATPAPPTPADQIELTLKADPVWIAMVRFLHANLPAMSGMSDQQVVDAIKSHAD